MTGFGGVFGSLTYGMSGLTVTCWRVWVGAALLLVVSAAVGRRPGWTTIRASLWPAAFLTADFMFFFEALKLTNVVDVTILGAMQPALVMVIARRMFHERLRMRDVVWVLVAIVGVTLAVLGPGTQTRHALEGGCLAVIAMLMWTGYWLTGKKVRVHHDAFEFTTSVLLLCSVMVIPVVLISSQSILKSRASDWKWIFLLAVIPSAGHIILNYSQKFLAASISSAIGCLNPLVASVAAVPILHQPLSLIQIVGLIIGLGAVTVIAANNREPDLQPPDTPASG
jgi:drug/metabolite transporter (DMT)-like permease